VEMPPAKLVVLDGKLSGKTFEIEKSLVLGRHPDLPGRIPDTKVSREHSKVYRQGVDWFVVDLNSRNGTLVNDAPVTKRLLRNGDEIRVGETRLRFDGAEPSAPPEPKATARAEVKEVIDLKAKPSPPKAPAGAIDADSIVVKDRALQFSKVEGRKRPSLFFDDLGQRSVLYQVLMGVVVLGVSALFLLLGLYLAGMIGGE